MPKGWYGTICAVCFEQLTAETAAVNDRGELVDVHPGRCADLVWKAPGETLHKQGTQS